MTSLRNLGLTDAEIAMSLQIVVAQRLVRTLCQDCRESRPVDESDARWLKSLGLPVSENTWHAVGCEKCRRVGYLGMTGVFEIWKLSESDIGNILSHADEMQLRRSLAERRHRPLLADGLSMVASGETTLKELRSLGNLYVPPRDTRSNVLLGEPFLDSGDAI